MLEELEAKYGFASQLSQLDNAQLVNQLNTEVGNRGWGNARSYFLCCLKSELNKRDFDSSFVVTEDGLRLNQKVELVGNRLQPVVD